MSADPMSAAAISKAAALLERAAITKRAIDPITPLLGAENIAVAYEVQQAVTRGRIEQGARVVGRKIGLTSEAVQRQIGVDRPDFGVLFDDMRYDSDEVIPFGRLLQPKAEAEVAFVLSKDIVTVAEADWAVVGAAVAEAFPAIEIVDSRIADWRIGIMDTVADNASSGVFVVGSRGTALSAFDPETVTMTMERAGDVVSQGVGADCLGSPLKALSWLAMTAIEFGSPLRAGDVVLSGALGPMIPVSPGDVFTATIDPLGTVTARFSTEEDA